MDLLKFMSDSPWLTFFLALIIGDVLCTLCKAIGGKYADFSWKAHYKHKEDMKKLDRGQNV